MVTYGQDAAAVAFLRAAATGTRVVVRYRLPEGDEAAATDALGYLSATSSTECVIATARGLTTIAFADVIAAKEVPPPPARSAR